jgi:hypothetical protein
VNTHDTRRSCLNSNNAWQRDANLLRQLAVRRHLSEDSRDILMREAVAADARADEWLNAAIDLPPQPLREDHEPFLKSRRAIPNTPSPSAGTIS